MIDVIIIRTGRKTMSLSVNDKLQAVVRAPYAALDIDIKSFVEDSGNWIENAVIQKEKQIKKFDISEKEIARLKALALKTIPKRVDYFSSLMGLKPTGVKITSAKKRFGSCSANNSLCFSFYLMNYSIEAIDYVVVHELAHIKRHNHSREFYELIEYYMPDYKNREKILKSI